MKCSIIIDESREEEVIVYAHSRNRLVEDIEDLVLQGHTELIGYGADGAIKKLSPSEVLCFATEGGRLYAHCEREKFEVRERIYMLEEMLGADFVKINQSCIANIKSIDRFKVSLGGALVVVFKNGYKDYVSRRQIKAVKERIGFKI